MQTKSFTGEIEISVKSVLGPYILYIIPGRLEWDVHSPLSYSTQPVSFRWVILQNILKRMCVLKHYAFGINSCIFVAKKQLL